MADNTQVVDSSNASQEPVGKVFIVYGTAKAISTDGTTKVLAPNSPIFAQDRIITESDGRVSIVFTDPTNSQLTLGRMSDIIIDEDVYSTATENIADATGEVEEVQEALLTESFDPTTELPAPAAGDTGGASDGGGHPIASFEATAMRGNITSGAETIGVERSFLDPIGGITEPQLASVVTQPPPIGIPDIAEIEEAAESSITGNLLDNDFSELKPLSVVSIEIDGSSFVIPKNGSITQPTDLGGQITIYSDGTYEYSAPPAVMHDYNDDGVSDPPVQESISYTITNEAGQTGSSALTINITDTAPIANDDITDQGDENAPISYNVIDNDTLGADDVTLTDAIINTGAGTVDFSSNGEVIYNPADGEEGTVIIDYTITDADGDTSQATLTINLAEDSAPTIGPESGTVYEAALAPDGSGVIPPGGSVTATGTLDITTGNDSIDEVRIGGETGVLVPVGGSTGAIAGTEGGELVVTESAGVYTWTYTQTNNTGHDQPINDTAVLDTFDLWVKDSDGDPESNTLEITIVDDVPDATGADSVNVAEDTPKDINVKVSDIEGADGVDWANTDPDQVFVKTQGSKGTAVYNDDGTFTYTPDAGAEGTDSFTYTITDSDGDSDSATITLSIAEDSTPTIGPESGTVYEAALAPDGSGVIPPGGSVTATGTLDITTGNDSIDEIRIGGETGVLVPVGGSTGSIAGTEGGELVVTESAGVYTWIYTQTNNTGHDQPINNTTVLDSFDLWVKDSDGDPESNTLEITIVDDVPTIETIGDLHFVSEFAGYDNAVGTYELDANGNPINAKIIIESTNNLVGGNMGTNEQLIGTHNVETKLFIIADGGDISDLDSADLVINPDGTLFINDIATSNDVFYMDSALNADAGEHFKDENGNFINSVPPEGGEIHIEDLPLSNSDADYNDVVLRFEKLAATVDEANLADGTDPDATALTTEGNLFTGAGAGFLAITIGADFNGSSLTVTSGTDTNTIYFDGVPSNEISVASAVGDLTIRGDGDWSYTLRENTLTHPDNDPGGVDVISDGDSDRGVDDQVQDTFDFLVTDGDGDTASTQFFVNINDDGPIAGDPQDAILAHEVDNSVTGDLNIDFGADGPSTIINAIQLSGTTSSDGSGDQTLYATDNAGNILTSGGENLVYHDDGNGGLIAKTVDTSVEIFRVTVDPTSETYTVTLNGTIDGAEYTCTDLTTGGIKSGIGDYYDFYTGDDNDSDGFGDVKIHITGLDFSGNPDEVNSSNIGLGIHNNWIDNPKPPQEDGPQDNPDSETMYMTFSDTTPVDPSDPSYSLTAAKITVGSLNFSEDAVWTVYNTNGSQDPADWTEIKSDSAHGTAKFNTTFTVDGGTDPLTGQPIEFDAIMLQAGDGDDYRVLNITTYSRSLGDDIDLTYDLQITDGDGDTATSSFDVTFDADGNITGTSADEVISGSSTANTITGGGGEDVIYGGDGNDTIFAQDGEPDIISGGDGVDTIEMDFSLDTLIDDPDPIV